MDQILYERPREKLKNRGASSLSTSELFQLILGSGSGQASVARLARAVAELFVNDAEVSYAALAAIYGLGDAKACQLLAVSELTRRSSTASAVGSHSKAVMAGSSGQLQSLRQAKAQTMAYTSLDGSKVPIKTRYQKINRSIAVSPIVRQIFADMISDQAASCSIAIGSKKYSLVPSMPELGLLKAVADTAALLQIPITSVQLVNAETDRGYVI